MIQNVSDPTSYQTHFMRQFPGTGTLAALPDHVTVKVHLQAIGDDVLASLVASGDLDPAVPPQIARYTLGGGAALDWTPTANNAFQATDATTGAVMTCVATGAYKSNTTPAVSHARCAGLAALVSAHKLQASASAPNARNVLRPNDSAPARSSLASRVRRSTASSSSVQMVAMFTPGGTGARPNARSRCRASPSWRMANARASVGLPAAQIRLNSQRDNRSAARRR